MAEQQRVPHLNEDRLCWLAVRDQLGKQSRRPGVFGWITILGSARGRSSAALGGSARRDAASDRMADFAIAVDEASNGLSHEERLHLRSTGEVPDWFLADVQRRAVGVRKGK